MLYSSTLLFGGDLIYQLIQLSPGALRIKIANAKSQEKKRYIQALLLRDVSLLSFAIVYITLFIKLFGSANSSVAVASFCMIIAMHFVGFGYRASDSIVSLAIVLFIMFIGGIAWFALPTSLGFIANFLSLLLIIILTSARPAFGNAGVYVFSYIFITGMTVTGSLIKTRAIALITVFTILSFIMIFKHSAFDSQHRLHHVFSQFNLQTKLTHWQLRLAFGVSSVIAIADWANINRPVWLGYACMSILLPQSGGYLGRATHRFAGIVIGSILFVLSVTYLPEQWFFILAPTAGFGLGLTINYFLHSVFNCFGALTLATSIYGLSASSELRIFDNGVGIFIALLCILGFKIIQNVLHNIGQMQFKHA